MPNSLVGSLIRCYWPGLYEPTPGGEKKLALRWDDYEVAKSASTSGTAAGAVITAFWVRQISSSFLHS
jgi:hypothetical protein